MISKRKGMGRLLERHGHFTVGPVNYVPVGMGQSWRVSCSNKYSHMDRRSTESGTATLFLLIGGGTMHLPQPMMH